MILFTYNKMPGYEKWNHMHGNSCFALHKITSSLTWKRMVNKTSVCMPHSRDAVGWKAGSGFTFVWSIYMLSALPGSMPASFTSCALKTLCNTENSKRELCMTPCLNMFHAIHVCLQPRNFGLGLGVRLVSWKASQFCSIIFTFRA